MSATDPYFTFPLSALRCGNSPYDMIDSLRCYGIVYAGLKTPQERFYELYSQAVQEFSIKTLPSPSNQVGRAVLVGAMVCNVRIDEWQDTMKRYRAVHSYCGASAWHLRMKSNWLARALDTALVEARLQPLNNDFDYLSKRITFREFRILAAVLSATASKPYDWLSSKTIQCRASSFMRGNDFGDGNGADIPAFLKPPLTRYQIDQTTKDLEPWGFFARFRLSSGKYGANTPTALGAKVATNFSNDSQAQSGRRQMFN